MIEENATVQDINKGVVTLQTIKSSACGRCKESDTCSTSILSKYFANKSIELNLDTDLPVKIGDYVTVGLEEQALVRLTVLIYFIPIIVMFVFAILGTFITDYLNITNELLIIAFALIGLGGSFIGLKKFGSYFFNLDKLNPVVLKIN